MRKLLAVMGLLLASLLLTYGVLWLATPVSQTLNLRATNEKRLRVRIYQSLRRMRHFTHWVNAKFCRLPHRGSGKW